MIWPQDTVKLAFFIAFERENFIACLVDKQIYDQGSTWNCKSEVILLLVEYIRWHILVDILRISILPLLLPSKIHLSFVVQFCSIWIIFLNTLLILVFIVNLNVLIIWIIFWILIINIFLIIVVTTIFKSLWSSSLSPSSLSFSSFYSFPTTVFTSFWSSSKFPCLLSLPPTIFPPQCY